MLSLICYCFDSLCYVFLVVVLCFRSLFFLVGPLVRALLNMLFDLFCVPCFWVVVLDSV